MAIKRVASDAELDDRDLSAPARHLKRVRVDHNFQGVTISAPVVEHRDQLHASCSLFPPVDEPLPASISLSTLCRDYPNHLCGKTLTRLIEAGWKPHQIYSVMNPAAQKALGKEKPWEVLQTRWDDEKKRMAQRNEATNDAINDAVDLIRPKTNLSITELENLIRKEVQKQQWLICGPKGLLSQSESDQRMLNIWVPRANRWATSYMEIANISEENIPSVRAQSTVFEIMDCQNSILKNAVHELYPIPENTNPKGLYSHLEAVARKVLYLQVQVLRVWTKEWEQNRPSDGGRPQAAGHNQGVKGDCRESETPESVRDKPRMFCPHNLDSFRLLHDHQTSMQMSTKLSENHTLNGGQTRQSKTPRTPREQLHQAHPYLQGQSELAWNGSLQTEGFGAQPQGQPYPQQAALFHMAQPNGQPYGTGDGHVTGGHVVPTSDSMNVSNFAAMPGRFYPATARTPSIPTGIQSWQHGNVGDLNMSAGYQQQPDNPRSVVNLGSQQPAVQKRRRQRTTQRGAPRKKFFVEAPPRDRPLPQSALEDDSIILNHFPEHLSHSVVMRRFVASSPTNPGGHRTREMVKALQQHIINGDQDGLTDHQRQIKIRRWIIKEKDSCNKKLKEGSVPSSVPPSMIATSARTQPVLQAPPGAVASFPASQPSLQSPSNANAPSAMLQTGLQASQVVQAPTSNPALAHPMILSPFNSAGALFDAVDTTNAVPLEPYTTSDFPSSACQFVPNQVDPRYPSPTFGQQVSLDWLDMKAEAASASTYATIGSIEPRQHTNDYSEGNFQWSISCS